MAEKLGVVRGVFPVSGRNTIVEIEFSSQTARVLIGDRIEFRRAKGRVWEASVAGVHGPGLRLEEPLALMFKNVPPDLDFAGLELWKV